MIVIGFKRHRLAEVEKKLQEEAAQNREKALQEKLNEKASKLHYLVSTQQVYTIIILSPNDIYYRTLIETFSYIPNSRYLEFTTLHLISNIS